MIYPATFEQKIGFDRLREQVAARCTMRAARERLAAEGFSTSAREIERRLALADEMRLLLDMEHDFPGGEYPDVDYIVAKLRVEGSFLDVEEVVTLRRALAAIGGIVSFIISREERYPALHARTRGVAAFPEIVQRIDGILDRFGQVKDNASPALQEIRRSIREREGQAAKRLQAVLSAAKGAGIVDADAQISIRDGKAVIPVSAGNKRKLNGFIHDESATGKTFYVEPVEVVEINNELRELEYAERREVVRILTEFTEAIRPDAGLIADSGDYLAEIDMLRAKGRWASENGCVRPILSTDDRLVLKNARHPLLQQTLRAAGREIVPLDLQLDRRKRILVISGPNAGGKSVCLKTTGIVQYMFQCGFPVPVSEVSELPVFESIFIDIGDEQSIDNDLSTYSSHLLNMKHMLAGASGRTLVLIDEFGSGTEPVIGGAIAEAILERLLGRGCYGVITTHYANIKYYAASVEGIANGAMMFDVQNIRPLFRLETGKPGSSFAVEIARKIGLPEEIIRAASEKAGSDHINIEKQLREIARDKHYSELFVCISLLILCISPLVWFFSQTLYYLKREKEFNILQSIGAVFKEIRQIYLQGGMCMAAMSLVVSIVLSYLGSYILFYIYNVIMPYFSGENVRYVFYMPWYAILTSIVVSVFCGFFSTYLPYRSYIKNRYSLQNGGAGGEHGDE